MGGVKGGGLGEGQEDEARVLALGGQELLHQPRDELRPQALVAGVGQHVDRGQLKNSVASTRYWADLPKGLDCIAWALLLGHQEIGRVEKGGVHARFEHALANKGRVRGGAWTKGHFAAGWGGGGAEGEVLLRGAWGCGWGLEGQGMADAEDK